MTQLRPSYAGHANDHEENFYWDGLALIKRDNTDYTIEPHVNGGSPILTTENTDHTEVLFNDMLGTSLGIVKNGVLSEIDRTSFGQTDNCPLITDDFFTGKPNVEDLGYTFLFRNYKPELGKWQTSDPLEYLDGWNKLAYVKNRVTTYIDFLGAWGREVHQTLTAVWVEAAGFTPEQAARIANADQGTDSGDTGPMPWQDQSRHFDTDGEDATDSRQTNADNEMARAVQEWQNGDQDAALDALGRALHSLQDIDAHGNYGDDNGTIWIPHDNCYDDPSDDRRTQEFINTFDRTILTVLDFRRRAGLPIPE